jgi:ring-1,2-phenylacetyl-CoA epoxidase subunit PaaD
MVAIRRIDAVPAAWAARLATRRRSTDDSLWALLDAVKDPEVPVLSLWELGVLQDVYRSGEAVVVVMTPTYSGCPAMHTMEEDVRACLAAAGHHDVAIVRRLSPAWTTDWLSPAASRLLHDYGIAPPEVMNCPQCGSPHVSLISEFGSTACKALYRCDSCREPFDHFKPI